MRFAATLVLWLATTVMLAVAIPAAWTQMNVIDADGYAAMAQNAAGDPALQSAMTAELTTRAMALIAAHGGGRYPVDSSQVHDAATAFTAGPSFPPLFAEANRRARRDSGQHLEVSRSPRLPWWSCSRLNRSHGGNLDAKTRQLSGNSANIGLVGCGDPVPGSTVNARAVDDPRLVRVAVVEGATAAVLIVPAEVGPWAPSNHI